MFEPYPKYRNAIPGKRLQILFHPRRVGARRQTTPLFAGKGGPHLRGVLHRAQTLMFLVPRSIATTKELIQDARDEIASRAAFSIPSGVRPNSSKRNFAEPVGLPLDPMFSAAKGRRIDPDLGRGAARCRDAGTRSPRGDGAGLPRRLRRASVRGARRLVVGCIRGRNSERVYVWCDAGALRPRGARFHRPPDRGCSRCGAGKRCNWDRQPRVDAAGVSQHGRWRQCLREA